MSSDFDGLYIFPAPCSRYQQFVNIYSNINKKQPRRARFAAVQAVLQAMKENLHVTATRNHNKANSRASSRRKKAADTGMYHHASVYIHHVVTDEAACHAARWQRKGSSDTAHLVGSFASGNVGDVPVDDDGSGVYVRTGILASMRKVRYNVTCSIDNKTVIVIVATRECPAYAGWKCNHVSSCYLL